MRLYVVFVLVSLYGYVGGDKAPFITPCVATDTACLLSSAQKAIPVLAAGVPSLGIKVLDPMYVERVSTSQSGLDMDFRDTIVKGLRNCKVEELKRKKDKTYLDLVCSVIMSGNYSLGGHLLLLPIQGEGPYKIKIRDIVVKIVYDISQRVSAGEVYWHIDSWKHSADVKTRVEFHFQNLFSGKNNELAKTVHDFANSNWKEIFHEVAPPIVAAIVGNIVTETTKLFDNVPAKYLALPRPNSTEYMSMPTL